jgi:hypothetical protein
LKRKYETKERALQKSAYEKEMEKTKNKREALKKVRAVRPPCINCERKVGTIFSSKNKKFIAVCGDARNPCKLNIEITNGYYSNHLQTIYHFKDLLEELKETIIRQKMDTLFKYIDEKKSVDLFKKNMEEYQSTNLLFKEMMETYEELYDNPHTNELIKRKEIEIFETMKYIRDLLKEYQKDLGIEENENSKYTIMDTIINIYKNELVPQIHSLRMLKNAVVEMEDQITLKKWKVSPTKLDYHYGDPPRVIHFVLQKN